MQGSLKDLFQVLIQMVKANKHIKRLQKNGYEAYYEIRNDYNMTHKPEDLLFLSRTCVNGLIRFNSNGDFKNVIENEGYKTRTAKSYLELLVMIRILEDEVDEIAEEIREEEEYAMDEEDVAAFENDETSEDESVEE